MSLSTDSSTVQSDTGGTVAFTGTLIGDPGDQLQGFDIVIDVVGLGLPSTDVSIENLTPRVFAPFNSGETARNGDDIFFGGFSPSAVDVSSELQLFTFDAVFRPGLTASQAFEFNLDSNDSDFSLRSGTGLVDLTTVRFNNATVLVTAVPEPGSLVSLVGLACGWGVYRRRRKTVVAAA